MLKSLSTSLILRGLVAIGVGIVAVVWPGVTVIALAVIFAVYAYLSAGVQAALAFSSRTAKPVIGHLLLGLVNVAAATAALVWPGVTALVLVLLVAGWAVVTGVLEIAAGVRSEQPAGARTTVVLGGLLSVVFGAVLYARPDMGALSLALLFGLFSLVSGTSILAQGIQLRSTDRHLASLTGMPSRQRTHAAA